LHPVDGGNKYLHWLGADIKDSVENIKVCVEEPA
jgi:hypothetical protein